MTDISNDIAKLGGGIPFVAHASGSSPGLTNGADCTAFRQVMVVPSVASGLTDATSVTVTLQHTDTNGSGWSNVPNCSQTLDLSGDQQDVGLAPTTALRRFVRVLASISGGATASFGVSIYGLFPKSSVTDADVAYNGQAVDA